MRNVTGMKAFFFLPSWACLLPQKDLRCLSETHQHTQVKEIDFGPGTDTQHAGLVSNLNHSEDSAESGGV